MRPSSSTSDAFAGDLLGPLSGDPEVDRAIGDRSLVQAMLEVESALAAAQAAAGVIPAEAAEAIAQAGVGLALDPAELGAESVASGNPVPPLVARLTAAVPEFARPWVHFAATSQDVFDTALVIVSKRAGATILCHLDNAGDACAGLASRYRDTVMVARTLGQPAEPTTFGRKAAGWLAGLDGAADRLSAVLENRLAAQLGGAVGTLGPLGAAAEDVANEFARRVGLRRPLLSWHTDRLTVLDLAAALGESAAATGKVALDLLLLAQQEVGEVQLADPGGSSAMPHKRNPVGAILVLAGSRQVPGLVGTLFSASVQAHERAVGAWHAEWQPWRSLLSVAGGMAARTGQILQGMTVNADRMRANLESLDGLPMAASVAGRLARNLGRTKAHDVVARCAEAAAGGRPFAEVLLADPDVTPYLDADAVSDALDPANWLTAAKTMVDRTVDAHSRRMASRTS